MPNVQSCNIALALVPATTEWIRFGPADKNVDLAVPRGWSYRDHGQDCSIVLGTKDGAVVRISWISLWLAASSILGMCVRQGSSGVYKNSGKYVLFPLEGLLIFYLEGNKEIFIGMFKEMPHVDIA